MIEYLKPAWNVARWKPSLTSLWKRLLIRIYYVRAFLWPDVILMEGRTEDGSSLSILRAGITDQQTAYFFAGQVFTELNTERALGRAWLWKLPALGRKHGCAFILFRVRRTRAGLARRMIRHTDFGMLHLPVLIHVSVDVSDKARLLECHSLRSDVRKVKKRGFQFSVSRKKQDLEIFIRKYHDPYVEKAHGFDAIGMDFQRLLEKCSNDQLPEHWELFKVELKGEWVAGMLLANEPGKAALMELGVKEADTTLVKLGALQAAYWLSIEYLHSQGHNQVSLMHARPFLNNGVLRYKLKYNPVLKAARPTDGFLLQFDKQTEASRKSLLKESFLTFNGDGLGAVWFSREPAASPDPSCIPIDRLANAGINDIDLLVLR